MKTGIVTGIVSICLGMGALAAYAKSAAPAAPAAAPRLIPYAGHLDLDGNPVTGTVAMKVCLVTDPATPCDAAAWSELHGAVAVAGGRFSMNLGETTPITDDTFKAVPALYVRVMVGGSSDAGASYVQLSGAQRVLSSPYAINAITAEQAAKLRVDGPIYNGAVIPTAPELGLYAEAQGGRIKFVTNSAPIQFSTDGTAVNGFSGSGTEPTTAVVQDGKFQLGVYVNEASGGPQDVYCNTGDIAISGGGRCVQGWDQMWLDSTVIKNGAQKPVGWHGVCMNHANSGLLGAPERIQVICIHHGN